MSEWKHLDIEKPKAIKENVSQCMSIATYIQKYSCSSLLIPVKLCWTNVRMRVIFFTLCIYLVTNKCIFYYHDYGYIQYIPWFFIIRSKNVKVRNADCYSTHPCTFISFFVYQYFCHVILLIMSKNKNQRKNTEKNLLVH